ncbi:hypothetical protein C9374_001294 [Naegleria lovaniensis]|uniref:CCDC81 HU domain-containing protein n=1 Tax=Naegleria lovaniensis TaxID=51637 RepID=A0AA88KLB5_NAELO|nr:uncharacterized protein C9374_001294 [Naegleria lovaniensis]KAG2387700.1 hypothetical protein C9374_001294 [Naegleria lovaniensis]
MPSEQEMDNESIADSKSIHSQTSSSIQHSYTIEDLLKDCERILHTQYGLKPSSPFRDVKYPLLKEIWDSIGRYLYQQLENVKSVSVNNIGRFSFLTSLLHTGNNGIIETKKVVFVMSEAFARDFNLKLRRNYRKFVDNSIPTVEVNYFLVAQKCCTTKEIVLFVMKILRNRLGEIMSGGKKVRIDFFSVGSLKCDKRIVSDFEFVDALKQPITEKQSSTGKMNSGSHRITSSEDLQLMASRTRKNSIKPSSWRNMLLLSQMNDKQHTKSKDPNDDSISVHSSVSSRSARSYTIKNQHQFQRPATASSTGSLTPRQVPRAFTKKSAHNRDETNNGSCISNRSNTNQNSMNKVELMNHQFSAALNYGPHDNGFRQPNAHAAATVMNLAVQRYAQQLESTRREQQQDLDLFYRQLIHNVCVSEELRRRKREEAQQVQTQLVQQMQHALLRKRSDDEQYSNYFNNEEDSDLDKNKNGLLMGFKKSARGSRDSNVQLRSSLPNPQMQRAYPFLSIDEQSPLQQGLHIPNRFELKNFFDETVRSK